MRRNFSNLLFQWFERAKIIFTSQQIQNIYETFGWYRSKPTSPKLEVEDAQGAPLVKIRGHLCFKLVQNWTVVWSEELWSLKFLQSTHLRVNQDYDDDWVWVALASGLPKVIFLAVAEAEGKGGKTSALKVKAEGEAEGLVFCI